MNNSQKVPSPPLKPVLIGFGIGAIAAYALIHNQPKYEYIHVRDDDIQYVVNAQNIRWIREKGDCMYICTKSNGCIMNPRWGETPEVCRGMKDYEKVKGWIGNT